MELDSARRQASESPGVRTPKSQRTPAQATPLTTNKKNEDTYDVEAALLSGGGRAFVPLAGILKRR